MIRVVGLLFSVCVLFLSPLQASEYRWIKSNGKVELLHKKTLNEPYNERVVWAFNYGKKVTKPYFHPITLPDNTVITRFKPKSREHPWHKGLWFSFKYINDVNYWEENKKTRDNGGLSIVVDTDIQTRDDFSAILLLTMVYQQRDGRKMVLEKRTINISAPDAQGDFSIDWLATFTAQQNIELGRTPLPHEKNGKPYGGYAGFSFRVAENLRKEWLYFASEQKDSKQLLTNKDLHRSQQHWVYAGGKQGGIVLFDHPSNSTDKTHWFVGGQHYFSPAFLHQANKAYKKGEQWKLMYRAKIYSKPSHHQQLHDDYLLYAQ